MTHWTQSREAVDQLAAAYVLGTLSGPARRRFEAVSRERPGVRAAVEDWEGRLHPMAQRLAPLAPAPGLWKRIEQQAYGGPAAAPKAESRFAAWWRQLLGPVPAGALAMGLVLGTLLPGVLGPMLRDEPTDTALPASYVGVLATASGATGLIVSSLRQGTQLDVKAVQAVAVPAGQTLYLWALDAAGKPRAIGPLPSGGFVKVRLPQPSELLFADAKELAVSLETIGATPAAPGGTFVYRGLCGKLWRVPAAK